MVPLLRRNVCLENPDPLLLIRETLRIVRRVCDQADQQPMLNIMDCAISDYAYYHDLSHIVYHDGVVDALERDPTGKTLIRMLPDHQILKETDQNLNEKVVQAYVWAYDQFKKTIRSGWQVVARDIVADFDQNEVSLRDFSAAEYALCTSHCLFRWHRRKHYAPIALDLMRSVFGTWLNWQDGCKHVHDADERHVRQYEKNLSGFDFMEYACSILLDKQIPSATKQAGMLLYQYPCLFRALQIEASGYYGDRLLTYGPSRS